MPGVADSAVGAILEIPPKSLKAIEEADKALMRLHEQSRKTADQIYGDFSNRIPRGLDVFIKKIEEANSKLGGLKTPSVDVSNSSKGITELANAVGAIDKNANTGSRRLTKIAEAMASLNANVPNNDALDKVAAGISKIGSTTQSTVDRISQLAQSMAMLAQSYKTLQAAQKASSNEASEGQINSLYAQRIRIMQQMEQIAAKNHVARLQGKEISEREVNIISKLRSEYDSLTNKIETLRSKKTEKNENAFFRGDLATELASARSVEKRNAAIEKAEQDITRIQEREAAKRAKLNEKEAKEREKALNKYLNERAVRPENAIRNAQNAQTLKQLEQAYKNLSIAMRAMNPNDPRWAMANKTYQDTKKKIDDIRASMGELKNQSASMGNVLSQLKGQLATVFSTAAIMGYIKKMVDVRAQFELQNVALRAILQNKDEADRIFNQVQQMALQSPFTIMQLTTYTKQLAAYRIESDKLVGTTKMLADVSAGLGVDMQRLILAYGQVKSANYLRATEVRQFTEAGLNIAGELANYFSELQGKMVTVGDVMEMITKRMVRFEDVEEVFKRVTSAGGLFYDMQKKQSESLFGQIQRISDAYSIMMNDIGKSNQGTISKVLTLIRDMIQSWRSLVPYVTAAITAMGTYTAVAAGWTIVNNVIKGSVLIYTALTKGIQAAKAAQTGLNITMAANPYAAVAAALAALAMYLYQVLTATSALDEELKRIGDESASDMGASIINYEKLAQTIRDTNSSYTERKEALDELSRSYKDILPTYLREAEYITTNGDAYAAATKKIKEYYQAKEYEKKVSAIREGDDYKKMMEHLEGLGERIFKGEFIDESVSEDMVKAFMRQIGEEFMSGETEATVEGFIKRFYEYFGKHARKYGNIVDNLGVKGGSGTLADVAKEMYGSDDLSDVIDRYKKINEQTDRVSDSLATATTLQEKLTASAKQHAQEVVDGAQKQINEINNQAKAYFELKVQLQKLESKGTWTKDEIVQMEMLRNKMKEAESSFYTLADQAIPGLDRSLLKNINTIFQLQDVLDIVSQNGFPTLAAKGANAMGVVKGEAQALIMEINNLLKQFNIAKGLKSEFTGPYTDADAPIVIVDENARKEWAKQRNKEYNDELKRNQNLLVARKKTNREILQDEAKRYNVENALTNEQILINDRTNKEYAKDLRALAKEKEEILRDWDAGDARSRKLLGYTDAEIKNMRNEVKFLKSTATVYDPYDESAKNKKGRTEDKELKYWQDLNKLIKDVTTSYEKYRKVYSVAESNRMIEQQYGPLFKELGTDIKVFYKDGKYDAEQLVTALGVLKGMVNETTEARKKFSHELSRDIEKTEVEIGIKAKKENIEKVKRQIDDMFANVELTKEFENLGLNIDLTYMVGGRPMTLDDAVKEIVKLKKEAGGKKGAEELIKIYEEAEKKITQITNKERKERLKSYQKYLGVMYSDRAQAMIKSYNTMKLMEEDFQQSIADLRKKMADPNASKEDIAKWSEQIKIMENQLSEGMLGVRNDMQETLNKLDWNSFKGSPIFQNMYKDVDNLQRKALVELIDRLETVRKKLQEAAKVDPKAVREVTQYIEKLKGALIGLNPFKDVSDIFKKVKEYQGQGITYEKAQTKLIDADAEVQAEERKLANLETLLSMKQREKEINEDDTRLTADQVALYKQYGNNLAKAVTDSRDKLSKDKQARDTAEQTVDDYEKAVSVIKSQIKKTEELRQQTLQMVDAVFQMADALGAQVDDEWKQLTKSIVDTIFQAVILTMQYELMGIALNSSMGIIGWIAMALQVIANLLAAIFAAHDKKLQKQIDKLHEKVENLQETFDKLKESIDNAFKATDLRRDTNAAIKNLEAQKRAYYEMISLESQKKDKDEDAIKDYYKKIKEINEQMSETEKLATQKWGGFGTMDEYASAAESFAQAWLDAFKETGDGLEALNEQWEEYLDNLIVRQMTLRIVGARMEELMKMVDKAVSAGSDGQQDLTRKELDEIEKKRQEVLAKLNEELKLFAEEMGIKGGGDYVLSDLQQGIQNITEPQAAAIEAYLNSMRFAVFRHTEQLDALLEAITMQYASPESPLLTELKGIRSVLDEIRGTLNSVVEYKMGKGAVLKID